MVAFKNSRLVISREIAASNMVVWDIITDTAKWCEWGPSISKVRTKHQHIYDGCSGSVHTAIGLWLPFKVISFEKPLFWSWKVAGIEATGHHITECGANRCRLAFDMPWWAIPYMLVCYVALRRIDRLSQKKHGNSFPDPHKW